MVSAFRFLCALGALIFAVQAGAAQYYLDSRSGGGDDPSLPRYRTPAEACVTGELVRRVQGYQENDTRQYRYRGANAGVDQGLGEFTCHGVIDRRFFSSGTWLTVETVATTVYGPFGGAEACALPNYLDPETQQCGVPKRTTCPPGKTCNGSNPIDTASGNKHQVETDFVGAGPFPLRFERYYDSQNVYRLAAQPIGIGWSHSYAARISVAPPASGGSTLSEAYVYRDDGSILVYKLSGGQWVGDADVSERLSVSIDGSGNYQSATFTTNDDTVEGYDNLGRLVSITNRDGFAQTLSYITGGTTSHNFVQSVTDPQGRALSFGYTSGRLSSLTDANGRVISYAYDASNNLSTATYPDTTGTKVRTYKYNETGQTGGVSQPNALTGIVDENNQRYASWGYTANGRANLSVHGAFSGGTADRTSFLFNANGTTTVTDALGRARIFGFTVRYLLARGATLDQPCNYCGTPYATRSYDANGYPSGGTDFRGFQTSNVYNTRGLETQRVEAIGQVQQRTTNTAWSPSFRVPTQRIVVNASGSNYARTDNVYNARGQPLARCDYNLAVSGASAYVCAVSGTPPAGVRRWTYTYCDAVDTTQCPLVGLRLSIDGPRTDVTDLTRFSYRLVDDTSATPLFRKGDLWTVTDALGRVTTFNSYDGNGRPLTIIDANGVLTTQSYHPRGWLSSRQVSTETTAYAYDGAGQLTRITLPNGAYQAYTYDAAHRLTDIRNELGETIHYTLDALGHRTREDVTNAAGTLTQTRSRTYNNLNRLTQDTGAVSGQTTAYGYDGNDNLTTITDPYTRVTTQGYDALNRLNQLDDARTGRTLWSYDALDQLQLVTAPNGAVTSLGVNALGDLQQESSADRGLTAYTYDAAGNVRTRTDARGIVASYSYDALNRLLSVSYPDASENQSYSYDASSGGPFACSNGLGRLCQVGDASGSTWLAYDAYGNLSRRAHRELGTTYTQSYAYDLNNRLTQLTTSDGRVISLTRDSQERVSQLSAVVNGSSSVLVSQLQYAPDGQVSSARYGNGISESFSYDQNGQRSGADYPGLADPGAGAPDNDVPALPLWGVVALALLLGRRLGRRPRRQPLSLVILGLLLCGLTLMVGAASPFLETSSYDLNRNLSARQTDLGTSTYRYDELNRLRQESGPFANQSFSYDANGNRLSDGAGSYTYLSASNRLNTRRGATVSFDAAGHLSADGSGLSFIYTQTGQLKTVSKNGVLQASYTYDYRGFRTRKVIGSLTTVYQDDAQGHLLQETAADGSARVTYVWRDDLPSAVIYAPGNASNPSTTQERLVYLHADALGSPRRATSTTARTVWRWESDAFGSSAAQADPDGDGQPTTLNLRLPGQYFDAESGLHYNWSRDYDPSTGRYVESDPIGLEGGVNTYGYARQNPLSFTDPTGSVPNGAEATCLIDPLQPVCVGGVVADVLTNLGIIVLSSQVAGDTDQSESRSIPKPEKPKCGCTCICRADANDNIPGNIRPGDKTFAFGEATASNCAEASKEAKRIATRALGKQPKHVGCRCSGS